MSVLITGGTGFLGVQVARLLVARGADPVVLFDMYPDADAVRDLGDSVEVVQGDFSDGIDLLKVLSTHDITEIVHLGYVIGEIHGNIHRAIEVNCSGTNLLFEAAMARGMRRVVWASSAAVYGSVTTSVAPVWCTETTECRHPTDSFYSACKLFNENNAEFYAQYAGLDHVALRLPATYGPRRGQRRALAPDFYAAFFENLPTGATTTAPPAEHIVTWSYVKDVAQAFYLALMAERPAHRIYNVPGIPSTVHEAVAIASELMPGMKVDYLAKAPHHLAYLNGDLIEQDLGFRPGPSIRESFADCIGG